LVDKIYMDRIDMIYKIQVYSTTKRQKLLQPTWNHNSF